MLTIIIPIKFHCYFKFLNMTGSRLNFAPAQFLVILMKFLTEIGLKN